LQALRKLSSEVHDQRTESASWPCIHTSMSLTIGLACHVEAAVGSRVYRPLECRADKLSMEAVERGFDTQQIHHCRSRDRPR
jgi:hypothetical protein